MAHALISNEKFLQLLIQIEQKNKEAYEKLMMRLGAPPKKPPMVTIFVVGKNEWEGHNLLFDFMIHHEKKMGKRVDQTKVRVISKKTAEEIAHHPLIEEADFFFFADEDIRDPGEYPELLQILPFL